MPAVRENALVPFVCLASGSVTLKLKLPKTRAHLLQSSSLPPSSVSLFFSSMSLQKLICLKFTVIFIWGFFVFVYFCGFVVTGGVCFGVCVCMYICGFLFCFLSVIVYGNAPYC